MPTHGQMIDEVSKELSEPFTVKQLADAIIKRYKSIRNINRESLKTDILGCCVNLKSHRSLMDLPLILLGLGGTGESRLLRRYNPETDTHANLYLTSAHAKLHQLESKKVSGRVRALHYNFKNAKTRLIEKDLLSEIHQIINSIDSVDHRHIQGAFGKAGWAIEYKIHHEVNWAWDAYKDKVAVSIELSLIDAVHRDFLRAVLAKRHNNLDILVYVTSASKEPKFHNVKRDIEIFKELLTFPILLIGLAR